MVYSSWFLPVRQAGIWFGKVIVAALAFCNSNILFSQSEFTGGLMAGPVTSQISGDGLGGWDKFGFAAGAWVNMSFSKKTGITMAMQFINKGSKKPADPNNFDYSTFRYNLNYIDVPLMFTWKNVSIKKTHLQINLGIYAGVLVKQNQQFDGGQSSINPPFESTDIGATGGAAFWFSDKTAIEFRTATSIIPTRPSPNPTNAWSYYEQGNYNQVLQLMFWLRF
ncbi:MAG: porin family protein [Flavobacteriales bacterium]|nr:porin family protein [Flavobacteriales bacterium]